MNNLPYNIQILCPKCGWEPDGKPYWKCSVCKTSWNTFDTRGVCPACNKVYEETACPRSRGGCGQMSLHNDWYVEIETSERKSSSIFFWRNKDELPITANDKKWIEQSFGQLLDMFGEGFVRSLPTITPEKKYFDRDFKGTEADVEYLLTRVTEIMHIDAWEIQLMFYSNRPTKFTEGIVATPQENLKGGWKSSSGEYIDKGLGLKEIWIELGLMNDPVGLISTLSHELAHYKLLGEYRMLENDELLTDLTAVLFGFGIFKGNSYFKFNQWTTNSHQGWQMKKSGYLPEQVIAYAMAWLADYRNEDISWKKYFNKTMLKYFDRCHKYLAT